MTLALLDAARRGFHVSGPQWLVGGIAAVIVLVCVLFHYEVMSLSSRWIPRLRLRRRARVVAVILIMLIAHSVEIWIFGVAFWFLDAWPELGQLSGSFDEGALDFVYFSVTSFTTLGFGDLVPSGAIRILCGGEALTGLSLITWSASFAFLEMQRDWREFRTPAQRSASPDPK